MKWRECGALEDVSQSGGPQQQVLFFFFSSSLGVGGGMKGGGGRVAGGKEGERFGDSCVALKKLHQQVMWILFLILQLFARTEVVEREFKSFT